LDSLFVLQSFAVVIIGGLGSIGGAFAASILLGLIEAVVAQYAPSFSGYAFYIAMALVLLLRPQGLVIHRRPRRPAAPIQTAEVPA
jgi:branched-chain amino acid transport system permease protein